MRIPRKYRPKKYPPISPGMSFGDWLPALFVLFSGIAVIAFGIWLTAKFG